MQLELPSLIAVMDDEDPFLDILRDLFEGEGYRVVVGGVLDGALALLRSDPPDLLVLDLTIGGERTAGLTLLRTLRADPPFARLPIIVASAAADLLATHAAEFAHRDVVTLEKPFDLFHLVDLAGSMIRAARWERVGIAVLEAPGTNANMGRLPAHADSEGGGG